MAQLEQLQPERVFAYFEELCQIPHGSGNCGAISNYLADFAQKRHLAYVQEPCGNVIIYKDGTSTSAKPVILQAHMDMVCVKTPGNSMDMALEGLRIGVDGDQIFARGTSLGGDDGIGVAMILAILESDDLPHPPLEAVFTVEEEVGMDGARALEGKLLQGRTMLNLDSETEGILTVGCAGGSVGLCTLPVTREAYDGTLLRLSLCGGTGGHSGEEIHRERANAVVLLGRVLDSISQATAMRLCTVQGGTKHNAIPVEAEAIVSVENSKAAREAVTRMEEILKAEFSPTDPQLHFELQTVEGAPVPLTQDATERVIILLTILPNGVQGYSRALAGQVSLSLNLGVLSTEACCVKLELLLRFAMASEKHMLKRKLTRAITVLGGTVAFSGDYPPWEYAPHSRLRPVLSGVYREITGAVPPEIIIHAGLECGFFAEKLPGLDCVSIGPQVSDIHTTNERLSISSTQRTWKILTETLKRL